jgi:hypothetical protein
MNMPTTVASVKLSPVDLAVGLQAALDNASLPHAGLLLGRVKKAFDINLMDGHDVLDAVDKIVNSPNFSGNTILLYQPIQRISEAQKIAALKKLETNPKWDALIASAAHAFTN